MEKLEVLPSVSRLSERVVRILGQNPGKFTLQGTNTYLVGARNPYTLIDTGEGREEYIPVLEATLRDIAKPVNPEEPDISDIVISHWHHDHVGGLPTVLALLKKLWTERNSATPFKPPRIHKFPLPPSSDESPFTRNTIPDLVKSIDPALYTSADNGDVFHALSHSQILSAPSTSLHVLHAPGHTEDLVCLYIPEDKAVYTSDNVLGQGTAVFEDLSKYISSLQSLLDFGKQPGNEFAILYPGHGPVVNDGADLISTYIKHRLEREEQVLQVLKASAAEASAAPTTTWTIVSIIYASYPESLWLPAAHSVSLHMEKLVKDGRVKKLGGEGKDTAWQLIDG
ncbi:hypothetical protein HGRIS_013648 [Hohenbuehelia grisea]|uniref:Metallo-beta-lactamase domain-containing protein n=1 Tax=Hohenbuehelia grisea TaxID=104357 RepID=A0ABR3IW07_9AGAR